MVYTFNFLLCSFQIAETTSRYGVRAVGLHLHPLAFKSWCPTLFTHDYAFVGTLWCHGLISGLCISSLVLMWRIHVYVFVHVWLRLSIRLFGLFGTVRVHNRKSSSPRKSKPKIAPRTHRQRTRALVRVPCDQMRLVHMPDGKNCSSACQAHGAGSSMLWVHGNACEQWFFTIFVNTIYITI